MADPVEQAIQNALGAGVTSHAPLTGGCIGEVLRVELDNGETVVAKVDGAANAKLDIEGYMLRYLADNSALPVPAVRHCTKNLLVMDYIPGNSNLSGKVQAHAAELLAGLHNVSADTFGLERDTLIGGLHQPNTQTASWVEFFRDHRLLYMAEKAAGEDRMNGRTLKRIEKFAGDLDQFIAEPEHPSLLHGDVWTTNVLAENGKVTGFVDPAIYYGHPEIELAFSTLFGTFGEAFFARYRELRTLEDGFFDVRRDIYNIYPLLVHVRLFGSSYLSGIETTLRRHGY